MNFRASARVLHFIPSMAGGGAEKQLALLAAALPAHGWNVDVAILDRGVHLERLERSGARLHFVPSASRYDPMIPLRLSHLIGRLKPHVVQTWLPQMDVAAGMAAVARRVPWIVSERVTRPLPPSIKRRLRDAITSRAKAVVSNSEAGLRGWAKRHPKIARFHVPNAIVLDEFESVQPADLSQYRITPQTRIIVAAGRLVLQKNMEALRAAMQYVTREIDAVALICGVGPQQEVLLEKIERDGQQDRVVLAGFVPDVAGWMKAADVVVSVSHFEGRPNAIMEAMALRTPLVVSDIPEHREILDSRSALLVDHGDLHDIANAILSVLNDSGAARARAAVARNAVDGWTPDAIAAEYARIYSQLARQD